MLSLLLLQEVATSNTVAFMHQMIPHHENAVNMARVLLKNPGDEELDEEVRALFEPCDCLPRNRAIQQ